MHFVEKENINFNENETEAKIGSPTHCFRETIDKDTAY